MRVIGVKMFTVGIASTMHSNFINCTHLLRSLENLLGEEHRGAVSVRLQQDPRWRDFSNKVQLCVIVTSKHSVMRFTGLTCPQWNLPLYYQLRTSEVGARIRSEAHTSEIPLLIRIPYAVFCLKPK